MRQSTVDLDGPVHYADFGGTGRPIVLVHGLGGSHVSGLGSGFAIAPRVGGNFMVGRSGVLTPAIQYQYTTVGGDDIGGTLLVGAVRSQFNAGRLEPRT